jgi:non-homologous end joining protein Ku
MSAPLSIRQLRAYWRKQAGEKIEAPEERAPSKVVNLMDALRRSIEAEGRQARGGSIG